MEEEKIDFNKLKQKIDQILLYPLDLIRIEIKSILELSILEEGAKYSIQDEPGRTEFIFSHDLYGDLGKIRLQVLPRNICRFISIFPPYPSRYDVSLILLRINNDQHKPSDVYSFLLAKEDKNKEYGITETDSIELDEEIIDYEGILGENSQTIIKDALIEIDSERPVYFIIRIKHYKKYINSIISALMQKGLWSQLKTVPQGKLGRDRDAVNDWAYEQVRIMNRRPKDVYPEWLVRIGKRANTLADPRDSFNKAIKPGRLKKTEKTD